ncbi:hypothetical protein JHK86_051291 [Glycine max]|nr:hypothetical protein JHK86_051291 [Glycine max]
MVRDLVRNGEKERCVRFGVVMHDFYAMAFARIVNHCFVSKGFFPSNSFLWDRLDKMRHINNTNVQSAWDLHRAWPEADFRVRLECCFCSNCIRWFSHFSGCYDNYVSSFKTLILIFCKTWSSGSRDAGHSANEPAITAELVATNEKLKNITKNKGECTEVSGQANRNSCSFI